MCLIREYHDDCERQVNPFLPLTFELIDLTSDVDINVADDVIDLTSDVDINAADDVIDLTSDVEISVVDDDDYEDDTDDEDIDEVVENSHRLFDDQRNYRYNMLPSVPSFDEGPTFTRTRGGILHFTRVDTYAAEPELTTVESSNETNQNTDNTSLNINFNITDTNNANQSNEGREFELNIPQILLSMSRIRIGRPASTSSPD